jgi:hypothetical protein
MSKVFIKENFFPVDVYNQITQEMFSVEYIAPPEDLREALEGSYWHEHKLLEQSDVGVVTKKLIKDNFKFNIKQLNLKYTMVGASDIPRPHVDSSTGATHQCLIHMYGEEAVNNGTGFYHKKENDELELSIHVGFKPNRAIFFSSDVYHAPLQWAGNGSWRYSLATFFF